MLDPAEEAYDRSEACSFTSFVGYEWTASGRVGHGENLHRNVVFENEKVPDLPPSWVETPSAYDLWDASSENSAWRGSPGCDALTIPHNSNLSGDGLMFATGNRLESPADKNGKVSKAEAKLRQRWEPLVEIMQHKGDSECLPGASNDEQCGFEKLAYNSFAGRAESGSALGRAGGAPRSFAGSARHVRAQGLKKGPRARERGSA